jgi:hypothetical protein
MYDLIGDIHGHAHELKRLLSELGYSDNQGIWSHPSRKVIFVGDYIDRGPSIREVLQIVKSMIDSNQAFAIMGNHEYNAIAFSHRLADGTYLRSHNSVHIKQHQGTIDQFSDFSAEWRQWVDWFYTLPLFLEIDGIRVVHSCWDTNHISWLKKNHGNLLTEKLLIDSHDKTKVEYAVINDILKGKEIGIPNEFAWVDKDGHARTSNRIKWWIDSSVNSFGSLIFNCPDGLKNELIPPDAMINSYLIEDPPVFFGHYWLEDDFPSVQTRNAVCLDYSVAKDGSLVAYRWSGESNLHENNFVYVGKRPSNTIFPT